MKILMEMQLLNLKWTAELQLDVERIKEKRRPAAIHLEIEGFGTPYSSYDDFLQFDKTLQDPEKQEKMVCN